MTSSEEVFQQLQRAARAAASGARQPPTSEYLMRHAIESFLERLSRTEHADELILKGGVLIAAYGARRPTKDVDTNVVGSELSEARVQETLSELARVDSADGVTFRLPALIENIRDDSDYPGFRVRVRARIGPAEVTMGWDISTGDPIVPAPARVTVERVLGDAFEVIGYRKETIIAEKGVTILQRGISSTRWRDYVDIVTLASGGIDEVLLLESARATARYRGVLLAPVAPLLRGYGAVMQTKWAAWRRRPDSPDGTEASLDAQVAIVAAILDPVFALGDV